MTNLRIGRPKDAYLGTVDSQGQPFCANCGKILAEHKDDGRWDRCPAEKEKES